ncbi:tripartite tricarboxylate transporter TctB family protein [Caenimonas aquaedulcis]|uniref:Tripartite tricarboxylate transporter TctB family protein n=1 Tax=Caenimonas aquaedulcis TaxID=2793270 RepID=A0A931H0N1_9BURK|nr:tripartite tricarboxylate transporter TctB family protein [Caenimonas aquaedulcis]MBG9386396.1 tripartite tricarboxylate transporter TctB family protein [Caenimonas aquaedulcis]
MTPQAATAMHNKRVGYFVTGGIGLLLSAVYLLLSREYPFGTLDEPGARVWPTVVGCMVIAASLAVLWEAWWMPPTEQFEMPAGGGAKRVVIMIVLLVLYFGTMEYLGQLVSSAIFCLLFMRLVSPLSWPRMVVASLCIAIGLQLVFVVLLKIPMPKGLLGI